MILFTIYDLFTMTVYDGNGRKTPKYIQIENKGKNSPFGCPPILHVYEMEADCFPVSETPKTSRTYPRWDGGPSLVGQRNTGLGAEWVDKSR